jgi:hyaluronan synthase
MLTPAEIVKIQEFIQTSWVYLIGYIPLGIVGVWRWLVWCLKKIISFFYRNPKGTFRATFSVITPVYNENPKMFKRALLSWKENQPEEIIAVIDYTDKKCIKVFKEFSRDFLGAKMIITQIPGKRAALADGIKASTGEIVALVDSDTIWTKKLKEKVLGPFAEKLVGGVAPRQDVIEADSLAKRLFRIHIFNRYGNDLIYQAAFGNALSCISGRTGIYRRSAIIHLTQELANETFLGKKCISGDDKRLTHLVQRDGWKVKYVEKALVYTCGFPDLKTYTKQQIRWTRNSWRADVKSLASFWLWKNPFLAFHTIDRFFQPFTLLLGPIFFVIALYKGDWLVALILVVWWILSRAVKISSHLKEHPADIFILPAYVLYCDVLAVIKIYTLLTVGEQSWITRWNKDRIDVVNIFKKYLAYGATLAIVLALFFISFYINIKLTDEKSFYEKARLEEIKKEEALFRTEVGSRFVSLGEDKFLEKEKALREKITADPFGYYQIKAEETISNVRQRYLIPLGAVIFTENKIPISAQDSVKEGDRIAIAIEDLRKPNLDFYRAESALPVGIFGRLTSPARILVTEDLEEKAMRVKSSIKGKLVFVTITQLAAAINDKNILENLGEKNWILRENLFIDNGVTLIIDGQDVSWLKLKSVSDNFSWIKNEDSEIVPSKTRMASWNQENADRFSWIKAENGNLIINKTKITSWNEEENDFDYDIEDGRSYILQKSNGRMDINESELAYLGYPGYPKRGNPFGGPYGVSWKIQNNSFRNELSTGSIRNSKIHHNFFGIYTFGATGAVFSNNEVFENLEYGIDPHDDSNNLLIEKNRVYKNGNHGIIASKRCFMNIIRSNSSVSNKLHGIMLDKDSNNNLVENNYASGNVNGIALNGSSENLTINNNFKENRFGIRANNFSNNNYFGYNYIAGSQKGVFVYQNSKDNYVFGNDFARSEIKIHLKQESPNFFNKN